MSFVIVLVAIYKITESFTLNLRYGELFGIQINIWVYRGIWLIMGCISSYAIFKYYKDKRLYGR